ncbi:hypothetical protein C0J45_0605 [Silurus meridionalis]|nr:hypothetical protein C0J45_0605 [Silurus meridionalis]
MVLNRAEVTFEDVIAAPASVHSFDKVWLLSHALFKVSRLYLYCFISLLLAGAVALFAGLLFSILSFLAHLAYNRYGATSADEHALGKSRVGQCFASYHLFFLL